MDTKTLLTGTKATEEIFKSLPVKGRQRVINKIINVNSQSHSIKGGDKYRYENGLKTNAVYRKCLFEAVLNSVLCAK